VLRPQPATLSTIKDTTAYKRLNRIGAGVLIYSRLKAFEGAVTVTPDDLPESFASQEFPTFAFASGADPDFSASSPRRVACGTHSRVYRRGWVADASG
jgi:hypothetical protein